MKRSLDAVASQISDPIKFRRINGFAVIFWTVMFPVSVIAGWMSVVVFVSVLSIYANWATHLSAWAASRAEARQVETDIDVSVTARAPRDGSGEAPECSLTIERLDERVRQLEGAVGLIVDEITAMVASRLDWTGTV